MKRFLFWTLAVVITLSAAVYQRLTGPTYPTKRVVTINGVEYKLKFLRSQGSEKFQDCELKFEIPDATVTGKIFYRKYPSNGEWESVNLVRENRKIKSYVMNKIFDKYEEDVLVGSLPYQPPAGKLEYYIELYDQTKTYDVAKDKPVKIRFVGAVPPYVIIPHIFFMFISMLLSNAAALFAIGKMKTYRLYTFSTLVAIFIGGMILGPIVQKFAFNEYWAGVPFGWDLTDNKTLIGFVAWSIAALLNWKKERPIYSIIAAVITIIIFSIPHSMFGSELDPNTGKIIQAFIQF